MQRNEIYENGHHAVSEIRQLKQMVSVRDAQIGD
jgi:hypothetical protein